MNLNPLILTNIQGSVYFKGKSLDHSNLSQCSLDSQLTDVSSFSFSSCLPCLFPHLGTWARRYEAITANQNKQKISRRLYWRDDFPSRRTMQSHNENLLRNDFKLNSAFPPTFSLLVTLFQLKTYHEVIDEIYYQVKHLEPWVSSGRDDDLSIFSVLNLFTSMLLMLDFLLLPCHVT